MTEHICAKPSPTLSATLFLGHEQACLDVNVKTDAVVPATSELESAFRSQKAWLAEHLSDPSLKVTDPVNVRWKLVLPHQQPIIFGCMGDRGNQCAERQADCIITSGLEWLKALLKEDATD